MAVAGAIIGVVGAGMQVYGALEEADAKAAQAERDAKLRREQKAELEYRTQKNLELIQNESDQLLSSAAANFGSNGLAAMEKIYANTQQVLAKTRREGAFDAGMIEQGALTSSLLAGEYKKAGDVSAIGYGVSGLGSGINNFSGASRSSGGSNVDNSGTKKISGT